MIDFTVKIGGEAGFGIITSGLLISKLASRLGFYVFDYLEYPSLIRGGHNALEIRISDKKVYHLKKNIDFLICFNKETFQKHHFRLTEGGIVFYDKNDFRLDKEIKIPSRLKFLSIPWSSILIEDGIKKEVMKNIVALGAFVSFLGGKFSDFEKLIYEIFSKKSEEVIKINLQLAFKGYDYVNKSFPKIKKNYFSKKIGKAKLLISGNEAFSLGAVMADCRFYAAYPMTPSSSVLHTLSEWQEETGMVVRHSEDEIAAINLALGASFAGVRSAVGTSGGGFSLMAESLSLAGVAELAVVVFLAQRPGPATGMPTWTEQGDLLFSCFAGHGEFPKIILAPGDHKEMFVLSLKAFNLADKYQTPVILISDMFLSESHESIERKFFDSVVNNYRVNRGKIKKFRTLKTTSDDKIIQAFPRYKLEPDGISSLIYPGTTGFFYQVNSYEHLEDGHTTEDPRVRIDQVNKRNKKWQTYLDQDFVLPTFYGSKEAEIVFIAWGSTKKTILQAQQILASEGVKTGFYHFNHIYPLNNQKLRSLFERKKRYILVENNSWGQFGKLIQMEVGYFFGEKILKYDGRPIYPEEIVMYLKKNSYYEKKH